MATTTIIPLHAGKGRSVATALGLSTDYVKNPHKTNDGEWVTAYACDPISVDAEFMFSKNQYAAITGRNQGARDVIGYHLRISFKPGETDAAMANRIGYDLAMKLTKGSHAFVCCTHTDKAHVHSHVIINSVSLDATKKFRNFKGSSFAVRRIADHLCIENGLSIVTNPKSSKGKDYGKWQGDNKPQSNRDKLRDMIDAALQNAKDYDAFLAAMIAAGCEVKQSANLSIKLPGAERFIRVKSLGDDYTEDAILERLMGLRQRAAAPNVRFAGTGDTKVNLVIDLQEKLQEGKSTGYLNWAKGFNLQQAAKSLIYLQENNLLDYGLLTKTVALSKAHFNKISDKIKADEKRMAEIKELQIHIGYYGKYRNTYRQYIASGRSEAFFEANRQAVTLCRAAKNYFSKLGMEKLPSIDQLKQEYAKLDANKGKLYAERKQAKQKMKDLLIVKQNTDWILDGPIYPAKLHERGVHTR